MLPPPPLPARVGLPWALPGPPCRLCSLPGDAVGDSFSQPLSCPGNRPGLCDLPRGENSSCRWPLPWISGHRARLLDESPQRQRLQGGEDGLFSLEDPLRCLSTQGPPRQPLGLLVGRDRRALCSHLTLTFHICGFLSPPAGGTPWPLGSCHVQPGWRLACWPSGPFQR